MNHRDTETQRRTKNFLLFENWVFSLCLCASVVRLFFLVLR
jgi:hypothetical protein